MDKKTFFVNKKKYILIFIRNARDSENGRYYEKKIQEGIINSQNKNYTG